MPASPAYPVFKEVPPYAGVDNELSNKAEPWKKGFITLGGRKPKAFWPGMEKQLPCPEYDLVLLLPVEKDSLEEKE
jgi:hypothetical protein